MGDLDNNGCLTNEDPVARQIQYYRRRLDELAGDNIRLDYTVSSLKLELRQKRQALSLLANLQQIVRQKQSVAAVYASVATAVNQYLNTDATIILSRESNSNHYTVSYGVDDADEIGRRIDLPSGLSSEGQSLLVNKATPQNPLVRSLKKAFRIPYFICVPILYENQVIGALVTGRRNEARPNTPPLDEGDLDTLKIISSFISDTFESSQSGLMNVTDIRTESSGGDLLEVERLLKPAFPFQLLGMTIDGFVHAPNDIDIIGFDVFTVGDMLYFSIVEPQMDVVWRSGTPMFVRSTVREVVAQFGEKPVSFDAADTICRRLNSFGLQPGYSLQLGSLNKSTREFHLLSSHHSLPILISESDASVMMTEDIEPDSYKPDLEAMGLRLKVMTLPKQGKLVLAGRSCYQVPLRESGQALGFRRLLALIKKQLVLAPDSLPEKVCAELVKLYDSDEYPRSLSLLSVSWAN